ncbi:MAG TPA: ATPase, partial [Actinomycetales bacterium]
LRSPQTLVHLVTLLEEMPVQETADGVRDLQAIGLRVGAVIVNMVREAVLPVRRLAAAGKGNLDVDEVGAGLAAAGLPSGTAVVDALLMEAREHSDRLALEKRERVAVGEIGLPVVELPALASGVDLGGLYLLAERLEEQGVA